MELANLSALMKSKMEQILADDIKIVSFDIFDTLLLRPVLNPQDVWSLVGKISGIPHFKDKRLISEIESKRYLNYPDEDCGIDAIYETFANLFGYTLETVLELKKLEMQLEYDILYPRKAVQLVYEEVLRAGKEIILVSDMYLPSDFLDDLLQKNGYTGYSRIYVSSETRVKKITGNMFLHVCNDLITQGINASEIMHVGDNYGSDFTQARKAGLKAVHIASTYDKARSYRYVRESLELSYADLDNSFLHGIMVNLFFDDPYREFDKASRYNGDATLLGYSLSPFFVSFLTWMMKEAHDDGIEQFLFVYRDGYLPEKMYEILKPHLPHLDTVRLYLSRSIRKVYFAENPTGLFDNARHYTNNKEISVREFIAKWVLVQSDDEFDKVFSIFSRWGYLSPDEPIGELKRYAHFLHEIEPYFKKNASSKIAMGDEYIAQQLDFNKKIGVFDCGARFGVNRLLGERFNAQNVGYSIVSDPRIFLALNKNSNTKFKAFVTHGKRVDKRIVMGMSIVSAFVEDIVCEPAPTAQGLMQTEDGIKLIRQIDGYQQESESLTQIRSAILEFTQIFSSLLGKYCNYLEFDRMSFFDALIDSMAMPQKIDAELMRDFKFVDSGFLDERDMYGTWYAGNFKKKAYDPHDTSLSERMRVWGYNTATKFGILEPTRKLYRRLFKGRQSASIVAEISNQVDSVISANVHMQADVNRVMVFGYMNAAAYKFLNSLSDAESDYQWIYFHANPASVQLKLFMPILPAPKPFEWGVVPQGININLPQSAKAVLAKHPQAALAAKQLRRMFPNTGHGYTEFLASEMARYYDALLSQTRPKAVLIWNACTPEGRIISSIAREYDIPILFIETGVLPFTLFFESGGQFGASWVARETEKFMALDVSAQEQKNAELLIRHWMETGANRYLQRKSDKLSAIIQKLELGKKTIFFAGEGFEGGNYPHDKHAQEYHTPMFGASYEALPLLAKLAKSNGWNLIYKPHPIIYRWRSEPSDIPSNVLFVDEGDINTVIDSADLVIGLTTSVTYSALIRGKPVLMLGYNQLKGKGCAYEAFSESEIEPAIKEALKYGHTDKQRLSFIKHVAQLNKYYLFDNLVSREHPSGQRVDAATALLLREINN